MISRSATLNLKNGNQPKLKTKLYHIGKIIILRIKDDLQMFVILFAEIEALRNRVVDKENEINAMRTNSFINLSKKWSI